MTTTDNPICPMTNAIDARNCDALPATPRLLEPRVPCRLGEAIFSAGIRPKITPVINDAMAANTNTGQRRDISFR